MKKILSVLCILACLLAFAGCADKKSEETTTETTTKKQTEEMDTKNYGDIFYESSAADTASLEAWLKDWQTLKGQPMYNKCILNILLIGMDDPEGERYGRSDAMIILSIDAIHKTTKLTSVWRDTYGYVQSPNDGDIYNKINSSDFYGGPELTVKTIESLYKVRIDGYVMTTFETFKELIDAMGGIYVDVTEAENTFLTETAQDSWHASAGKNVKLNGTEALVYSRIRKLDSDIKRTERHRKVLCAMIKRISELKADELFDTIDAYLNKGYVTTNFSKKDITKYGNKALLGGWADYKVEQITAPVAVSDDAYDTEFYWGGNYNGAWVWLVDIPKTATDVQKFIYGESFCKLNANRHTLADFIPN
ncbi:MAG: LCP family protein [Clostridia bacterium]|nr:LCP family protein [Clostridia bacterium]